MDHEKLPYEDYLHCDRVWQRVAPELEPYPQVRSAPEGMMCCSAALRRREAELMGDWIDHELADRQTYCRQMRCAPAAARRVLRQLAEEEGAHARKLMGLYYMLTGQCFRPALQPADAEALPWCAFLRRRYEEECAGGFAYRKAAEEAEDDCLRRILERLAADEYRHAELLLQLLEENLPQQLAMECRR